MNELMENYLFSHLVILTALVLVSVFFSAVETGLLSFPKPMLDSKSRQTGILGRAFKEWQDHPNRILTSILIGNNAVNIAATTLSAYTAVHVAEVLNWNRTAVGTVAFIAVTFILIVFGKVIPKVAARANSIWTATWLVVPIYLFDRISNT